MLIVISVIGILASILVPNFRPALEFVEVLIAEKYLLKAFKECDIGLVNNEIRPQYTLPKDDINLGIFKKNKFTFSYTGISEECSPELGGKTLCWFLTRRHGAVVSANTEAQQSRLS